MENDKKLRKQNDKELTQEQTYKVEDITFVVNRVFDETSSNTVSKALYSLMRDEVENFQSL